MAQWHGPAPQPCDSPQWADATWAERRADKGEPIFRFISANIEEGSAWSGVTGTCGVLLKPES